MVLGTTGRMPSQPSFRHMCPSCACFTRIIDNATDAYPLQPFFLLLTFGYKLIHQTKMIKLEDMDFSRGDVNEEEQKDPVYSSAWRRILGWLLVN